LRILLVEDDKWMSNALVYHLKKEKYAVDIAMDGEMGLELALSADYDMAILDRMLPKLDGLSLLRQLREAGKIYPVLFLTAMDAITDRVDGLDAGADDYMVKPFATQEMLARVRALCRRPGKTIEEESLKLEDLELLPRAGLLRCNGHETELTPKETQLLELLARNRGQVITRDVIMDRVWGPMESVEPGNIDSYIHFLRGKMQDIDTPWRIKTVRGMGYRLERSQDV
jgi:DNA-binding response OmpR family regulator